MVSVPRKAAFYARQAVSIHLIMCLSKLVGPCKGGVNNTFQGNKKVLNLPHEFSSEPSVQSFSPLQNRPRSIQLPSPQARNPSWQSGSSVISRGLIFRSRLLLLQFLTASFQSHVCFSMSKYRPAGHRMACRPWTKKDKRHAGINKYPATTKSRAYLWI